MYRIDNATSVTTLPAPAAVGPNPNGFFGPGTILEQDWANAVQEEQIAILTAAGITPSKTNRAQVLAALQALFTGKQQFTFSTGGAGWTKIPMSGGFNFIIQWGGTTFSCPGAGITTTAFTLPMTYPNSHMFALANYSGTSPPGSTNSVAASPSSVSQITLSMYAPGTSSYGLTYFSMGY